MAITTQNIPKPIRWLLGFFSLIHLLPVVGLTLSLFALIFGIVLPVDVYEVFILSMPYIYLLLLPIAGFYCYLTWNNYYINPGNHWVWRIGLLFPVSMMIAVPAFWVVHIRKVVQEGPAKESPEDVFEYEDGFLE